MAEFWQDWREGAILRVLAEISQISDALGLDGVANLIFYLVDEGKWGVNSSLYSVS
jgi:hypothetical protein